MNIAAIIEQEFGNIYDLDNYQEVESLYNGAFCRSPIKIYLQTSIFMEDYLDSEGFLKRANEHKKYHFIYPMREFEDDILWNDPELEKELTESKPFLHIMSPASKARDLFKLPENSKEGYEIITPAKMAEIGEDGFLWYGVDTCQVIFNRINTLLFKDRANEHTMQLWVSFLENFINSYEKELSRIRKYQQDNNMRWEL